MCSILGLSSDHDVAPTIVDSLKRMEYRGYDSVGVAVKNNSDISVKKGVGKINYAPKDSIEKRMIIGTSF